MRLRIFNDQGARNSSPVLTNSYPAFKGTGVSPSWLALALDSDDAIKATAHRLLAKRNGKPIKNGSPAEARIERILIKHVTRIFEEVLLVEVLEKFEEIKPLIAQYVLAKEAARLGRPERFPPEHVTGVLDADNPY